MAAPSKEGREYSDKYGTMRERIQRAIREPPGLASPYCGCMSPIAAPKSPAGSIRC